MFSRLILSLSIIGLLTSNTNALNDSDFAFGNPPVLEADAERNGGNVRIWGTVDDENVNTIQISVEFEGNSMVYPVVVENGVFDLAIPAPIFVSKAIIVAEDDEQLEDSLVVTF